MRKLWECDDWSKYIPSGSRKGLRLRFDSGVDCEVRRACKDFVAWLRTLYEFPIRIPIYFKASKNIMSRSDEYVSASFFGPYDKSVEPYIRISVGDYPDLLCERGKDDALASILHSIAHELSHYYQWIKDSDLSEEKLERQAQYYASEILLDYADTRAHP